MTKMESLPVKCSIFCNGPKYDTWNASVWGKEDLGNGFWGIWREFSHLFRVFIDVGIGRLLIYEDVHLWSTFWGSYVQTTTNFIVFCNMYTVIRLTHRPYLNFYFLYWICKYLYKAILHEECSTMSEKYSKTNLSDVNF